MSRTAFAEAAARVGYASRSQFSLAFSGQFATTPTAYRGNLVAA